MLFLKVDPKSQILLSICALGSRLPRPPLSGQPSQIAAASHGALLTATRRPWHVWLQGCIPSWRCHLGWPAVPAPCQAAMTKLPASWKGLKSCIWKIKSSTPSRQPTTLQESCMRLPCSVGVCQGLKGTPFKNSLDAFWMMRLNSPPVTKSLLSLPFNASSIAR
jgi:hypothetical protein